MNILKPKRIAEQIPALSRQRPWGQTFILIMLAVMLVASALPGYLAGRWSWSDVPAIANRHHLNRLQNSGLVVANFQTRERATIPINGKKWSVQLLQEGGRNPIVLMLLPQAYYLDQPMTEWSDIRGFEKWKTDGESTLTFSSQGLDGNNIKAKLFKAWNTDTFAVVQWYAWRGGGSAYPSDWFWRDQTFQKQKQRLPWVAVSLKVPIEPLSDFTSYRPRLLELAQAVQYSLETEVFEPMAVPRS